MHRPLASSMFAPGVPVIMADFHNTSNTFATFVVSIFVLGFAAGPLVLAPLSPHAMGWRPPRFNQNVIVSSSATSNIGGPPDEIEIA